MDAAVPKRVKILALLGSLIQICVAFAILFLPVLSVCYLNENGCRHETYTQQGGSLVGYLSFALLIVLGGIAIWGSRRATIQQARRILWDVALASLAICLLTVWGLGLTFVPVSLLIFLAALSARPQAAS
jgi:hypothetical protein